MAGEDYRHLPQEPQHRVYHLSCSHCGQHLSDRAMRAVLLLRPSIILFSTDCMPLNCGPATLDDEQAGADTVERTCTCLTQNLSCYGCGNTVGYHIIRPCSQCVQSVTQQQSTRSANGHRWVFHADEVVPRERRFVYGEPSVSPSHAHSRHVPSLDYHLQHNSAASRLYMPTFEIGGAGGRSLLADIRSPNRSPYPDLEDERQWADQPAPANLTDSASKLDGEPHAAPSPAAAREAGPAARRPPVSAADQRPFKRGRPSQVTPGLRHGDVLFWHMLKDSGDRTPTSDPTLRIQSRPAR